MTYVFSPPSTFSFTGQGGSWASNTWEQKASNTGHNGTTVFCYGIVGTTGTDAIFRLNATTGVVTFEVNSADTAGTPQAWSQHTTTYAGFPGSQPSSLSSDGDTLAAGNIVHMWDAHSGAVFLKGYFTFDSSWISTGSGSGGSGGSGRNTLTVPQLALSTEQLVGSGFSAGTYFFKGPLGTNESSQPGWVDRTITVASDGLVSELNENFVDGDYEFSNQATVTYPNNPGDVFIELILRTKKVFFNFW